MEKKEPVQAATEKETFERLCRDFDIDDGILKLFMKSPIANLMDLRYLFAKDEEVDLFVAQVTPNYKDLELGVQVARVRRAWHAVRLTGQRLEQGHTAMAAAEMDDLLEEATLNSIKSKFSIRIMNHFFVCRCCIV